MREKESKVDIFIKKISRAVKEEVLEVGRQMCAEQLAKLSDHAKHLIQRSKNL